MNAEEKFAETQSIKKNVDDFIDKSPAPEKTTISPPPDEELPRPGTSVTPIAAPRQTTPKKSNAAGLTTEDIHIDNSDITDKMMKKAGNKGGGRERSDNCRNKQRTSHRRRRVCANFRSGPNTGEAITKQIMDTFGNPALRNFLLEPDSLQQVADNYYQTLQNHMTKTKGNKRELNKNQTQNYIHN